MKNLRRPVVLGTLSVALAAAAAIGASGAMAGTPVAACATEAGYFLQDASAFPLTMAVDAAGNQDGWVCVKFLDTPEQAHVGLVVIDDHVAS